MARSWHDHLVMGSFKRAAACVLAHLVGTCPGTHLCMAGQLRLADACAHPAGIAHHRTGLHLQWGGAYFLQPFGGWLQGIVWQHDLQHAMWVTLLAMESKGPGG